MKQTKMVTIVGNVGAGKSSALDLVAKTLNGRPVDADNLFQTSDPFAKNFLNDQPRWALANELWLTKERVDLLKNEMLKTEQDWMVVDSGLLMSWVYAYSHVLVKKMTLDEWELYEDFFDRLRVGLESRVVVLLDYSLATLMKRIQKRGRDYELEFYTKQYVGQLQLGIEALVDKLEKTNVKLLKIFEGDVSDFVSSTEGRNLFKEKIKSI